MSDLQSLRERIQTLTKPFHDELEGISLAKELANGTISKVRYARYLQKLYKLHAILETHCANNWETNSINITQRSRLALLEQDLHALKQSISYDAPITHNLPNNFATSIGIMYVLEGSTMGGQILSQRLQHLVGEDNKPATRYFQAYGQHTYPMWQEYCTFLQSIKEDHDDIIVAACRTYLLIKRYCLEEV